jgi:hypothetical protein
MGVMRMTEQPFQRLWRLVGGFGAATCQFVVSGLYHRICKNLPARAHDASNCRGPAPGSGSHVLRHSNACSISLTLHYLGPSGPAVLHLELELKTVFVWLLARWIRPSRPTLNVCQT